LKNQQKQHLRKTFLCVALLLGFVFTSTAQARSRNYCTKVSRSQSRKLTQGFKQSPIVFLNQFLQASIQQMENPKGRNQVIASSFDLRKVYIANFLSFKSKVISNSLFDWVRTQYFGNLKNNYVLTNKSLLLKNQDLLSRTELLNMKNFKPQWSAVQKVRCSRKERSRLGCGKSMLKVTLQLLPEVTCKKRQLKKAFEADFYLTYSSRLGFKILDLKLSGKRIVLDSVEMMLSLQEDGFNKDAVAKRLNLLSLGQTTFRLPKKQIHSGRFLANFQKKNLEERMPASL